MPHVMTQWEGMAWRRDDPGRKRTSTTSMDRKGKSAPSTPRGNTSGFGTSAASPLQQGFLTPSSVYSTTFDPRPSPSSSISSVSSFTPVFELEDTSGSPQQRKFSRSTATEQDSLKITVYSPEIATIDVPSPARPARGRIESVALTSRISERFSRLEEDIHNLSQQLSAKDAELIAKDRALTTALHVADERQELIFTLTAQLEHCQTYHIGPPTPPKNATYTSSSAQTSPPTSRTRPVTAGHLSSVFSSAFTSESNRSAGLRISEPLPTFLCHAAAVSQLPQFQRIFLPLAEAQEQQARKNEQNDFRQPQQQPQQLQKSLRPRTSAPIMSGGLDDAGPSGVVRRRERNMEVKMEMVERRKGGLMKRFGRMNENGYI